MRNYLATKKVSTQGATKKLILAFIVSLFISNVSFAQNYQGYNGGGYCPANQQQYAQDLVMQGGQRVCVYPNVQHNNSQSYGANGGIRGGNLQVNGNFGGNYNSNYQQSYTTQERRCGQYLPQDGQAFTVKSNGYRSPIYYWDSRLNQWMQR